MVRFAICDDDINTTGQIESLLHELEPIFCQKFEITVFYSGEEFCDHINKSSNVFDIVLMDIEMKKITGVEAGRRLREDIANNQTILIYISSHKSYFEQIIDLNVFSFIAKPIKQDDIINKLHNAIDYITHRQQRSSSPNHIIKINSSEIHVPLRSIMYLESDLRQINLYTTDEKYTYYAKLEKEKEKLPERIFCRIHKSYLISFFHILKITALDITMSNNKTFIIGSTYIEKVKDAYSRYREWERNYGHL